MRAKRHKRQMRNPEKWIGKLVPGDMELVQTIGNGRELIMYDTCDNCQAFHRLNNLHALLWPMSEADWKLQKALHVEEAQGFCPDCLGWFETEADKLDPEWRMRQGL